MKRSKLSTLFALHLMLMLYSMSEICSKKAAGESFLSVRFCLYYGTVILLLGVYAIGWQQVIKRIPLTTAFANKAVTGCGALCGGRCSSTRRSPRASCWARRWLSPG